MKGNGFKSRLLPVLRHVSRNPKELSEIISKNFGNLGNLFESDIRKLKAITKNDSASELLLVIATLASRKSTEEFKFGKRHTEEEIKNYLKGFYINAPVESVVIMSLDKEKKVIASDTVSDGTVNFSSVIPRQIIEKLAERGAEDFIMAHNHPGGVAEPSESDVVSTLNLATALEACGIHLKAHYVVAGGECNEIKFQEK